MLSPTLELFKSSLSLSGENMAKRRIRREQSDEKIFTLSLLLSDTKMAKRRSRSDCEILRAEDFSGTLCCPPIILSFALGGTGLRSLANAPSSIFIEKVCTFSTLASISNIDFFEMPDLASIKENVGFSKVEETPSHFLSGVKMPKHHDEAENPERAKRRSRRRARRKYFQDFALAVRHEYDRLKKSERAR